MKPYIEQRAIDVANFIINRNATVRETAKKFGISKSTVHIVVTKQKYWKILFTSYFNVNYTIICVSK